MNEDNILVGDNRASSKLMNTISTQIQKETDVQLQTQLPDPNPRKALGNLLPPPVTNYATGYLSANYEDTYRTDSEGVRHRVYDSYDYTKSAQENNEILAQQQTTTDKWVNGLTKFLGKTATSVIGGTVGAVNGVFEFAKTGNLSSIYNNSFNSKMNDLNEAMEYKLPNYYTQEEQNKSLLGQVGTANFWANDFLGGLSFTAGAIVSEGLWATATGGASLVTSLARLGAKAGAKNLLKKTLGKEMLLEGGELLASSTINRGLATNLGKLGSIANTARFAYTSAGYESSIESLSYMKEMRENFNQDFQAKNGRLPDSSDYEAFERNLVDGANSVFGMNMALVGSSNLAVFGKVLDVKTPSFGISEKLNKKLFGIGLDSSGKSALQATRAQKIAGKVFDLTKPMVVEGIWEEGGQGVVSKSFQNYVQSTYDPKYTNGSMDFSEAFLNGMEETFTTKEGFKEVLLGMIIGLVAGKGSNLATGQGFSELSGAKREVEAQIAFNTSFGSDRISQALINSGVTQFAKTSSNETLAENVMYSNKTQASTELEEGSTDFISSHMARQQGIMAQLAMANNLNQYDDVVEDTTLALKNTSVQDISKQYDITVEEAENFKQAIIEEYQRTSREYKKNRDFVEYYFGDEIKTVSNTSAKVMKDAVAFIMTSGEGTYRLSKDLLESIKTDLVNFQGLDQTVNIISALDSLTEEARQEVNTNIDSIKSNKIELDSLRTTLAQLQAETVSQTEDTQKSSANRLNEVSQKIITLEQQNRDLESKVNNALKTKRLFTQEFGDGTTFINQDQLVNIEEALNELEDVISSLKQTDPVKGEALDSKLEAYKTTSQAFREFAIVNREISEGAINLSKRKSLYAKLTRNAKLNEREEAFLETIAQRIDQTSQYESTIQELLNQVKLQKEELAKEENTFETDEQESVKVAVLGYDSLVANNPYLQGRFTEDELNSAFNNAETIGRFVELTEKGRQNSDGDILLSEILESDTLTPEEKQELNDLVNILSTLNVAEGFSNENITLGDILKQNAQIKESESIETVTTNEITPDTFTDMTTDEVLNSPLENQEDTSNTVLGVQVSEKDGNLFIHNITLPTLLEGINYVGLVVIDEQGNAQRAELNNVPSVSGTKVRITTVLGDELLLAVDDKRRIKISNKEAKSNLQVLENNSNFRKIKYRHGRGHNYAFLYENGKMLDSDFQTTDRYNYEAIYDLNQGDALSFEVDMNDPYNQYLKDSNDPDAEFKVKIYITDDKGNVVGEVKASQLSGISNSDNFNLLRMEAFEVFKNGGGLLKYQADVRKILLGTPNLTISEAGIPEVVSFGTQNIVDYGYANKGTLDLREKTENVNKDFLAKLKGVNEVPIVVFKRGNQLVAIPVQVKGQSSLRGQFYTQLMETDNTNTTKNVIALNEELISNKIPTSLYFNSPQDQNIYNPDGSLTQTFLDLMSQLNLVQIKPNIKEMDLQTLAGSIESAVDFDNNPIVSPKIRFDLNKMYTNRINSVTIEEVEETPQQEVTEEVYKEVLEIVQETPQTTAIEGEFMNEENSKYFRNSKTYSLVDRRTFPPTITIDALSPENSFLEDMTGIQDILLMEFNSVTNTGLVRIRTVDEQGYSSTRFFDNVIFKRAQPYAGTETVENPQGAIKTDEVLQEGVKMVIKDSSVEFTLPPYVKGQDEANDALWEFTYSKLLKDGDRIYPKGTTNNLRYKKGVVMNNDTKLPFSNNKRPDFSNGALVIRERNNNFSLSSLNVLRIDEQLSNKVEREKKQC